MNHKSGILFFDLEITGHHVEYLYHLITYRISHPECPNFVLVTHPDFTNRLCAFNLPRDWQSRGIAVIHPSEQEMLRLTGTRPIFKQAAVEFRILCKNIQEHQISRCYLMMLNKFQFVVGSRIGKTLPCDIRGIIFNPFGAIDNRTSFWLLKFRKHCQMLWMLRNPKLEHIYILNDNDVAQYLNRRYHRTNFFVSLPDPILRPPGVGHYDMAAPSFNPSKKTHFLLFGSLSERKGIFLVLEALKLLPDDIHYGVEVIFAGRLVGQDREAFLTAFSEFQRIRPSLDIRLMDEFMPYESIPELFSVVDCVLAPYVGNQASSGVLGHAALYGKPVIGPDRGLVGKLIRGYGLGIAIESMDAEKLAAAITSFSKNKVKHIDTTGMERFVQERHPYRFVEMLIG